jgi:tetratricopeptide (TPR) repeat protein
VCRCAFKAVVTTNYDPGIVNARMRVRPGASATGFTTWEDELGLDRWRTEDVFGEAELPVLFAHGQHNRPDSVVLATTEYRRAYEGKLPHVLGRLVDAGHLAWIGFSFADQRIAAILREIADRTGTRVDPGTAPRHIAVMPWDPAGEGNDPQILARRAEIGYGAQVVLYPTPSDDHSALVLLLSSLADLRFPPAGDLPTRAGPPVKIRSPDVAVGGPVVPVTWVPEMEQLQHFTGRTEELARLDRWAADPQVSLVGVTAWGGAGKTALVTQWVGEVGGLSRRPGLRGLFGWSFFADPSAEHWAAGLLKWAQRELGTQVTDIDRPTAAAVLELLGAVPLLLVLDGLEVVQESPAGEGSGRLLDGMLREVLSGACQLPHGGLLMLTSRFPFADLETFDGGSARMLEVPPFTLAEGSELLAAASGDWLADPERRALVQAVDGHALAVGVLAGLLAAHPPTSDLAALRGELAAAVRTSARVGRVLQFYADRLSEPDRYLLAAVSLFTRPVPAAAVLTLVEHDAFAGRLAGWTPAMVENAAKGRLGGLVTWSPNGTVSAHPLVRETFRLLVMDAAAAAAETTLTGIPAGKVASRADGLLVVEAVELLLDADQWQAADSMYVALADRGRVFLDLPAARIGQRAEAAFVATPARREACADHLGTLSLGFYLAGVSLHAMNGGDLVTAQEYLPMAVRHYRDTGNMVYLSIVLQILARCLGYLGKTGAASEAAAEAVTCAQRSGDQKEIYDSHAYLGWLMALTGDTAQAAQQFTAADQGQVANSPDGYHLHGLTGTWWAEWLARTARPGPARALTDRNREVCRRNGWNEEVARCDRQLGCLALAAGDTAAAGGHLTAAAHCFRDGESLNELAITLADLAEHARAVGDTDTAERHATEAITIARPRGLVPALSTALAARARIRVSRATATTSPDPDHLAQGRDAADAALRLATRHHLAWYELDALRAHALLDQTEDIDHGWVAQSGVLHARLVPPNLDPDPLATVERLVADQKAAEHERRGDRPGRE